MYQTLGYFSSIHRLCLFSTITRRESGFPGLASIESARRILVLLAGHGSTLEAATVAIEPKNVSPKRDETNERRWVGDMRNRADRTGIFTAKDRHSGA